MNYLVKKLLLKDPLKRPNCDQILDFELIQALANMELKPDLIKATQMVATIKQPSDFMFMKTSDFPGAKYSQE